MAPPFPISGFAVNVAVVYATDFDQVSPGGIQNFIRRVGSAAPAGMEITYFGLGHPSALPRSGDHFHAVAPTASGRVNLAFARSLRSLRAHLAANFEAVVAHRVEHVFALPRQTPLILVLHGGSWNALRGTHRSFGLAYPFIEAFACRQARSVLSVDSESHAWPARAAARSIVQINVPAAEVFRAAEPPPRNDILLTASRLAPEKRIDILIRLAAASRRRLVIFGDGPQRAELARLAASLAANVEFRGTVTDAQLAAEYRRGGTFCLSSAFEGYPLAAVEAATSGLPVLAVQSSAVRQLEHLGAVTTASVDDAVNLLNRGHPMPIPIEAAWRDHCPQAVAAKLWGEVGAHL